MKFKIIEHYNNENGHLRGYTLAYKPFPFIPYWKELREFYGSKQQLEHDICWMLNLNGLLKYTQRFE